MTEDQFIEMVHGSVDDDFYLDEDEDKGLLQHATANGISAQRAHMLIDRVCDEIGGAREKALLEELRRMLEQRTKEDKYLDEGEEAECLAICNPATGKQKGLDEGKAQQFVASFCEARGYGRGRTDRARQATAASTTSGGGRKVAIGLGLVLVAGAAAAFAFRGGQSTVPVPAPSADIAVHVAEPSGVVAPPPVPPPPPPPPPRSPLDGARRAILEKHLADAEYALQRKAFTTPADGSVIYFVSKFYAEVHGSEKQASDFSILDKRRTAICRGAVDYYCSRYQEQPIDPKWKERATVMAGTCQEPELLSPCFDSDK